jgi:hypothetical protein
VIGNFVGNVSTTDPKFNINEAFPSLKEYYGLLAGAAFTIPIAVIGIFTVSLLLYLEISFPRVLFLTESTEFGYYALRVHSGAP